MKLRKIGVFLMILCMLLALAACTGAVGDEDATMRSQAQDMIDAIIAGDEQGAYAMIAGACTEAEFRQFYTQVRQVLSGVKTYELRQINWRVNTANGVTQKMAQFVMTAEQGTFLVEVVLHSQIQGLAGFHISLYEETTTTGTLTTLKGAAPAQWGFLILGLLEIAFVIWAIVDCARQKIKGKAPWLLGIIFGAFTLIFTVSQSGFNFQFNYSLFFGYTAMVSNSAGAVMIRLFVPVGAIVYLCRRRSLIAAAAAEAAAQAAAMEMPVYPWPPAQGQPAPQEQTQPQEAYIEEEEKDA